MKQTKRIWPFAMVALGGVLLDLRLRLYWVAVDEKNLLLPGHPLSWAMWAVMTAAIVLALTAALRTEEAKALTAASPLAALGAGLFALAICLTVMGMDVSPNLLGRLCMAFGWLSVPCLGYTAYTHAAGKKPFYGCFCVVCLFFALYLVQNYQLWSSNPQLQDYVFPMLAGVMATLFAYQNAALTLGCGSRRMWLTTGLLAVCFGIAGMDGIPELFLYAAIAGWALTGLLAGEKTEEG